MRLAHHLQDKRPDIHNHVHQVTPKGQSYEHYNFCESVGQVSKAARFAKGNSFAKGHGAPLDNQNTKGHGAPARNINAVKT